MKKLLVPIVIIFFAVILLSCNKNTFDKDSISNETHDYYSTAINNTTNTTVANEQATFSDRPNINQSEGEEIMTGNVYLSGMYTRSDVAYYCKRIGFGTWFEDPEYVAAKYIYESAELSDIYGDNFEITEIWGPSEMGVVFFPNIYSGESNLSIVIHGDVWRVDVVKEKFGKWKVVACYLSPEDSNPN